MHALSRTDRHQASAGSLGSWARMAGSGSSGTLAAPTRTGWAKRASMTSNWQNRHPLPSLPPRTRTQRMTQVSSLHCLSRKCSSYKQSVRESHLQSPLVAAEGELMEKSSHPTAMMLTSTVNLLKTLSLSAGIYAEVLQTDATRTLCGLLRMLVESGANDKSGSQTAVMIKSVSSFFERRGILSGNHLCCQAVTPTGWCLGSSTGAGARWASYAASLSCPRCAARSAPLRGSASSSE